MRHTHKSASSTRCCKTCLFFILGHQRYFSAHDTHILDLVSGKLPRAPASCPEAKATVLLIHHQSLLRNHLTLFQGDSSLRYLRLQRALRSHAFLHPTQPAGAATSYAARVFADLPGRWLHRHAILASTPSVLCSPSRHDAFG